MPDKFQVKVTDAIGATVNVTLTKRQLLIARSWLKDVPDDIEFIVFRTRDGQNIRITPVENFLGMVDSD